MATKRQYLASLTFQADIKQAEQAINKLNGQLNKLLARTTNDVNGLGISTDLQKSIGLAAQLKNQLDSSRNSTGGLDLSKFNDSLKASHTKLSDYRTALGALGVEGDKAFMQLTQAIATAEIPLRRTGKLTTELWTTLKNTAKWQISSSVLHGFMGAIQTAYGYAKDLNESLNNIRIVTGQSTDQMAKFAEQANKAARALSSTTTDYTNASLIYYQQGLSDEEVQKRTDVTIKMANAAGVSAELVSDQLTAVWNNFAKGGENLEWYADVMTALGAATASSTSEISDGLEKFAAVADTVGLSYEYATAALATVTATTRQSADVVGTSFRTLFARIQGLNLGETLDDGTTLNKYSTALASVGINIKDVNGDIKDMDTILNELGGKWNTLAKDQQIALAETVAGVRQYTQLIALMDNWDYFQENLDVVANASGTLQEQADTYAESWEASRDRVQAAAEAIYSSLIDDNFFITINKMTEGFLDGINNVIKGMGGLSGVILGLGFTFTQVFDTQLSKGIDNFLYSIKMSSAAGKQEIQRLKDEAVDALKTISFDAPVPSYGRIATADGGETNVVQQAYEQQVDTQIRLQQSASNLSELEQRTLNTLIAQNQERVIAVQKAAEEGVLAEEELEKQQEILKYVETQTTGNQFTGVKQAVDEIQGLVKAQSQFKEFTQTLNSSSPANVNQYREAFKVIDQDSINLLESYGVHFQDVQNLLNGTSTNANDLDAAIKQLSASFTTNIDTTEAVMVMQNELASALQNTGRGEKEASIMAEQITAAFVRNSQAQADLKNRISSLGQGIGSFNQYLEKAAGAGYSFGQTMNAISSTAMGVFSIFNTIKGLGTLWNNDDISLGEKLLTTMVNMAMVGGQLTRILNIENLARIRNTKTKREEWLANIKAVFITKTETETKKENAVVTGEQIVADTLAAKAKKALANASAFLTKTLAGQLIIVGLVIAAVAGFIAIYKKIKENSPEAKLAKVNEELKDLETAANNAEQACTSLQDTLDKFKESSEKLKGLDRTTEEFRDTLLETNEQAYDLIETLGLLQGKDWHFGENGEVVFDTDLGEISKQINADRIAATGTNYFANQRKEDNLNNLTGNYTKYLQDTGTLNKETISQLADAIAKERWQSSEEGGLQGVADILGGQLGNSLAQDLQAGNFSSEQLVNSLYAALGQTPGFADAAKQQNANEIAIASDSQHTGLVRQGLVSSYDTLVSHAADNLTINSLSTALKTALPYAIESVEQDGGKFAVKFAGDQEATNLTAQEVRDLINQSYTNKALEQQADEIDKGIDDYVKTLSEDEKAIFDKVKAYGANSLTQAERATYDSMRDNFNNSDFASTYGLELEAASSNAFDLAIGSTQAAVGRFKEQWSAVWSELKDLTAGDTIDPEVYNRLSENQKQFFAVTEDGQYQLIATAEQVKEAFLEENQERLRNAQSALQNSVTEAGTNLDEVTKWVSHILEQGAYEGNYSTDGRFGQWINGILGTPEAAITQEAQVAAAQAWIDKLNEVESSLASTAQNLNELENMSISSEAKSNAFENVLSTEAGYFDIDVDEVYEYAEYLQSINDYLKDNPQLSKKVALAVKEINNAIEDLADNFEDYNEILVDDSLEGTEEYSKALKAVTKDVEGLTGVDKKYFSKGFLTSDATLEALNDISNGVDGAFEHFQDLAKQEIIANVTLNEGSIDDVTTKLDAFLLEQGNLEIGATVAVDDSEALGAFQELLDSGAITVDGLNALFDEFGFEPEVEWVPLPEENRDSYHGVVRRWNDRTGDYEEVQYDSDTMANSQLLMPIIKSATRKTNRTAAAAPALQRAAAPKSSSGGEGSSRKAPEKKNASDEIDRYHVVKNQLEDLQDVYDDTSDAADRLFGQARVDKIEDSIKATDDLIEKQKEYLAQIQANLPIDRAVLSAYYKDLFGGDIVYDELGNISNYEEIMNKALETYNRNTDILGEEDWNVFEKKYEQFKKYLDQYEETYDLLREEENNLQELINQRIDAQLEKIQYEIELKVNTADDGLALLEYQLNNLDDKAFAAAEAIELFGEKAELIYDKIAADREGLERVLGETLSGAEIQQVFQGNFDVLNGRQLTENQASAIQQYRDDLLDLNEELAEVRDEMGEKLMQVFDDFNEKLQEGIDKFDHYNSVMENFRNIVDIVGQDYLGITNDMLKGLDKAMVDNAINKVSGTKDAYDSLMAAQVRAQAAYEDALRRNSQDDILYWQQVLHDIGAEVESAQENWMQAWEDALDSAREIFEANVERAIDDFEKALLPFGDMEQFSDAYDKQQELADQYLDDYQKIYELSKLARDVNNSIDDTDNIASKQKLKDLLDKINKAQEDGVELSQYDLEYLQKEYDLRMAEIAMEEAQNAKNTVRLTRDNEGNWSYTYTNDSDMAADTAQKYEDALYAMQELSSNYVDEMSDQLISTSKEMEEALAAVRVEDYASIEEYYKRLDEIQSYYLERMKYMQSEMQKALDNNKDLYEQDWQRYHDATGYKISDNDKFAMSYQDTVLGSLMGSEDDIVDFTDKLKDALGDEMGGLIGNLLFSYQEWADNTDRAMEAAGTSTDKFAEDMQDAVSGPGGISEQSAQATESVEDMANQMVSGFDSVTSAVESWQKHYSEAMEKVIKDNLAMIESFNALLSILSGTMPDNLDMEQLRNYLSSPQGSLGQGGKQFSDASSFDSGGYTGSWGPNGRMAILHQKELVLNQQDTENLLSSVELLQQISKVIDLNTLSAGAGLGNIGAATARAQTGSLQQEVSITAEFPNATDHNEIELAMRNLINTAAQYANRK